MQQYGKRVFKARGIHLSLAANERRYAVRFAQQGHGLVEEVRTEVVDRASTGDHLVLPFRGVGGGFLGTVPIEVRFVFDNAAEDVAFD